MKCPNCGQKVSLRKILNISHNHSTEKTFQCQVCNSNIGLKNQFFVQKALSALVFLLGAIFIFFEIISQKYFNISPQLNMLLLSSLVLAFIFLLPYIVVKYLIKLDVKTNKHDVTVSKSLLKNIKSEKQSNKIIRKIIAIFIFAIFAAAIYVPGKNEFGELGINVIYASIVIVYFVYLLVKKFK